VAVARRINAGEGLDRKAWRIVARRSRHLLATRKDAVGRGDPDSIHDLRVATRRLQEALDLFAPVLPTREGRRLRRRARQMRRHLAALRDADVIAGLASGFPEARQLLRTLALAPRALRARSVARAGGVRVPGVRKRAAALARACATRRDPLPLLTEERAQEQAITALRRRADRIQSIRNRLRIEHAEEAHVLRVAVKRYRYTLELLDEAGIAHPGPALQEARRVQEALGALHDLDMLIHLVERRREARPWIAALRRKRRAAAAAARARLTAFHPWRAP
jgi:CHAD domain-containing protein